MSHAKHAAKITFIFPVIVSLRISTDLTDNDGYNKGCYTEKDVQVINTTAF